MCRSVPQIPVLSTRMSTSSRPTGGSGTSSIHRPRSARALTSARTSGAVAVRFQPVGDLHPALEAGDQPDLVVLRDVVHSGVADGLYARHQRGVGVPRGEQRLHAPHGREVEPERVVGVVVLLAARVDRAHRLAEVLSGTAVTTVLQLEGPGPFGDGRERAGDLRDVRADVLFEVLDDLLEVVERLFGRVPQLGLEGILVFAHVALPYVARFAGRHSTGSTPPGPEEREAAGPPRRRSARPPSPTAAPAQRRAARPSRRVRRAWRCCSPRPGRAPRVAAPRAAPASRSRRGSPGRRRRSLRHDPRRCGSPPRGCPPPAARRSALPPRPRGSPPACPPPRGGWRPAGHPRRAAPPPASRPVRS